MEQRYDYFVKLAAVVTLIVGCFLVLKPFLTATLFAAVVCVTTCPLYLRLLHVMRGRKIIAALVMTIALTCLVILPLALVAYNLADNVTAFYNDIKSAIELRPIDAPKWLKNIPLIGNSAYEYWHLIATSQHDMDALIKRLLEPTKNYMLAGGIFLGLGVVEMSLAAFVSFFFYRDGLSLVHFLNVTMNRI
jgi:predicted PurR-regulated permease PerM